MMGQRRQTRRDVGGSVRHVTALALRGLAGLTLLTLLPLLTGLTGLTLLLLGQSAAHAQLQGYLDVGGGALFSRDQREYLSYDGPGGGIAGGVAYPLAYGVLAELRTGIALFQATQERTGSLSELGVGARIELPTPLSRTYIAPAVHLFAAQTGRRTRPSMLAGARLSFQVTDEFAVGPSLSYGRVFDFGARATTDPEYWLLSLSLIARHDPLPRPPRLDQRKSPLKGGWRARKPAPPRTPRPPTELPPTELSIELTSLLDEAVTTRQEVLLVPPVLFPTDRAEPIACGEAALFFALEALQRIEGPVEIEGHADTRGDNLHNLELSRARAEYVYDWLASHGTDEARLHIAAHGDHENLVAERNDDGRRQLNRRVTFRVIRTPEAPQYTESAVTGQSDPDAAAQPQTGGDSGAGSDVSE